MHFTITTKLFHLQDRDSKLIEKYVKKLVRFIPFDDPDYPLLDIILRKHSQKGRDHLEKKLISEMSVAPVKGRETVDSPIYFDGTLDLILPKKRLVARMLGKSAHEAIDDGFEELLKELDDYKGQYFVNDSDFESHKSIK